MGDFKIRALPRGDEKPAASAAPDAPAGPPRLLIYAGVIALLALAAMLWQGQKTQGPAAAREVSSTPRRINDEVNKHLQEAELKREMMVHQTEIENYQFKAAADNNPTHPELWTIPDDRILGVQLDSDNSAEEIFQDLNESQVVFNDMSPADRINARLETRKWVNETERAERRQFLANIIRAAYDKGYELQINQDLIVTGVRPVNRDRPVNIDKVLDRLAKGQ